MLGQVAAFINITYLFGITKKFHYII